MLNNLFIIVLASIVLYQILTATEYAADAVTLCHLAGMWGLQVCWKMECVVKTSQEACQPLQIDTWTRKHNNSRPDKIRSTMRSVQNRRMKSRETSALASIELVEKRGGHKHSHMNPL